jgi:hypothetical protein
MSDKAPDDKSKPADDTSTKPNDAKSKKKDAKVAAPAVVRKPLTPLEELRANLELIIKATEQRSQGPILRVLRRTNNVRRTLSNLDLARAVETYMSAANPCKAGLLAGILELTETAVAPQSSSAASTLSDVASEIAANSGAVAAASASAPQAPEELPALASTAPAGTPQPAVEAYLSNFVITKLLKDNKNDAAAELASKALSHFSQFNQRNLDVFTAQTVSHLSLAHQCLGTLSSLRHFLLKAHRTACLQHNEVGQATIINLLLRNYLNDNLYDQAAKLVAKIRFPEAASANQCVKRRSRGVEGGGGNDRRGIGYAGDESSCPFLAQRLATATATAALSTSARELVVTRAAHHHSPPRLTCPPHPHAAGTRGTCTTWAASGACSSSTRSRTVTCSRRIARRRRTLPRASVRP